MYIMKKEREFANDFISASRKNFSGDMNPHGHNFFELEFVIDGSGVYLIDGKEYEIKKNMLFFMTPANIHAIRSSDMELINVMFRSNGEILSFNDLNCLSAAVELGAEEGAFLYSLFSELVSVYKNDGEYARLLLKCICHKLIGTPVTAKKSCEHYVSSTMVYMFENFRYGITLGSAAKNVGLSKAYLSDCFLKQTGTNFSTYLDGLRFSYAATLLELTDMPVNDIYTASGFVDYSNFSRRFKECYGVSPLQYRKSRKK